MKTLPRILEAGRVDPAGGRTERKLEHAMEEGLEQTRASQQRLRALRDDLTTAAEIAKAAVELAKCGDQLIPGDNRLGGPSSKLLDLAASGVGALAQAAEPARLRGELLEAQLEASLSARRRARRA